MVQFLHFHYFLERKINNSLIIVLLQGMIERGFLNTKGTITMENAFVAQKERDFENCKQKKIFVFDLHDVLFARNYWTVLKFLLSMKNKFSFACVLFNPFFVIDAFKMLFITRVSEAYVVKLSDKHTQLQPYVETIIDLTNVLRPISEMFSLVQSLKEAGHKIYIFSNIGQQTYEKLTQHYHHFFSCFDGVHYAHAQNDWLAKPHQNAYRLFLEKFTIDPTSMIFIDDKYKNIASARTLGITAIQYRSAQQLVDYLKKKKLINATDIPCNAL